MVVSYFISSVFVVCFVALQTILDPNKPAGSLQADGSVVEFGGNTPTGGKFAKAWNMHGWVADPDHKGDSGFKKKSQSFYDDDVDDVQDGSADDMRNKDSERQARIRKEVLKCTPEEDDDDDDDDDE